MAVTMTWNVLTMDVVKSQDGLTDVVSNVHWECTAVDENGVSVRSIGVETMPSPVPEEFIAFESLTKDQVLEWVKSVKFGDGEDQMTEAEFNTKLENSVAQKANPPVVTKKPAAW